MRRLLLPCAVLVAVLPVCSCGMLKKLHLFSRKHSPAPTSKNSDVFIGVVESVNPEQKFVLVRTELRMAVAPGAKLEAHSANGARALLVVTPERKMNFLSADITEGSPAAGDVVILPASAAATAAGSVGTGAATVGGAAQEQSAQAPVMRPPAAGEPVLPLPTR